MSDCISTHLLLAVKEELVRVNAITDGTSQEGDPMKYQRWLGFVPSMKDQLIGHVDEDSNWHCHCHIGSQ